MEAFFLKLVDMSIPASWLVLVIVAVRLLFRQLPKWISCLLWGLVALRLICPFSIESALSLVPDTQLPPQALFYSMGSESWTLREPWFWRKTLSPLHRAKGKFWIPVVMWYWKNPCLLPPVPSQHRHRS